MISAVSLRAGFLFICLAGYAGLALGQLPGRFSLEINGQVRYADSKAPVENAIVNLESFSGGMTNQVVTDRTGKFRFSGLVGTQYIVIVHVPGYVEFREDINLVTNNSGYVNALLVPDRSSIQNTRTNSLNPDLLPKLIDANVPVEAQKEYAAGKQLQNQGSKESLTQALAHFEKAIQIYPKYLDAKIMIGLAYMDLGQWDQAEKALLAAIDINPNASTPYLALGDIYTRQKKYSKAEEVQIKGVKLNDSSAEGHFALADTYWAMASGGSNDANQLRGWFENAWREVKRSLELNPKLASAHLLSGNLLLKAQRAKEALDHFEEYLKLEPNGEYAEQTKSLVDKLKKALAESEKKGGTSR